MKWNRLCLGCLAIGVLLLMAASCHSPSSTHKTQSMAPGNMTPFDDQNWQTGPKILPRAELLTALKKKLGGNKRRLWRIPVVVELEAEGLRGIKEVFVAVKASMEKTDRIQLRLQDGALGVSLADRLRQYCPNGTTCRLWIAGYWGSDMPTTFGDEGEERPDKPYPFSLRAVLGPQAADEATNETAKVRFRDE